MAVREVLRLPHPALKQVCRPVELSDRAAVEALAADLVETMRSHPRCVGLAASQIGELVRLVVVDVGGHPRATSSSGLVVLANPSLVLAEGSELAREGCLSVPDLTANVRRAIRVVVEGATPSGEPRSVDAEGFEARCLQHELDHLDGILFLDRVDSLTADVFRRRTYS
jgi:peptide deformylase